MKDWNLEALLVTLKGAIVEGVQLLVGAAVEVIPIVLALVHAIVANLSATTAATT